MAVKIERANKVEGKQEVKKEEQTGLRPIDAVVIKMLQRFDMIQVYSDAIATKVNELCEDLVNINTGNPLVLMHIKSINQLLGDIDAQIAQATTEDMKG